MPSPRPSAPPPPPPRPAGPAQPPRPVGPKVPAFLILTVVGGVALIVGGVTGGMLHLWSLAPYATAPVLAAMYSLLPSREWRRAVTP